MCGGWDDRHDLRPDQGDAFTGTIMAENSQMLLRHILEAPYPDESKVGIQLKAQNVTDTLQHSSFSPAQLIESLSSVDQQNFNKLRDAYDACMDEETIKKDGVKPLLEILHQVADMFSVQESAFQRRTPLTAKDSDDLSDTVLYLAKLGVSSLVLFGAGADDKDPDTVVVQASPPWRIGLPAKDYYKDGNVVKRYEDTLAQIIENLHPDHKDYAHDVIEFEKNLAAASPDAEDRDDVTVSLSSSPRLSDLLNLFSEILQSYVSQKRRLSYSTDPSSFYH